MKGLPQWGTERAGGSWLSGCRGFSCEEHHVPQGILCLSFSSQYSHGCACVHTTQGPHARAHALGCTWVVWSHSEAPVSVLPLPCPSWCPGLPLLLGEEVGGVWACRVAGAALTASVTRLSACRVPHSCLQGSCLHRTGSQSSPGRRQSAGTNTGDASFL